MSETGLTTEQATELVKKKRKREEQRIHVEDGENAKYLAHGMDMMFWDRPRMDDPQQVQNRIMEYFELCKANDMKPSIEGLSVAFDTDRKTMWRWVNGTTKYIPDSSCHTLKKAYQIINALMADYMQNGKINPVAGIFLMKNNMGYSDQTEVIVTPNNVLGDQASTEQLAEAYIDTDIADE